VLKLADAFAATVVVAACVTVRVCVLSKLVLRFVVPL
jgi:hypothetical protein